MTKETEIPALMLSIAFEQFMGALRHYVACWLRVHISEAAGRYFFLFRAHARELLGAGALGLLVGFNSTFISAALVATWGK